MEELRLELEAVEKEFQQARAEESQLQVEFDVWQVECEQLKAVIRDNDEILSLLDDVRKYQRSDDVVELEVRSKIHYVLEVIICRFCWKQKTLDSLKMEVANHQSICDGLEKEQTSTIAEIEATRSQRRAVMESCVRLQLEHELLQQEGRTTIGASQFTQQPEGTIVGSVIDTIISPFQRLPTLFRSE